LRFLKDELSFGPEDPLFPSTRVGHGIDRTYEEGLSSRLWTTAAPIRSIFRAAFAAAHLPYSNPHSFRNTLVRLGQRLRLTPEEWKAWSQNLGHESESTTFVGYGRVPSYRQAEIMRALARPRRAALLDNLDIAALEAFVNSAKAARTV
jgi:integrase/recombinase XerD